MRTLCGRGIVVQRSVVRSIVVRRSSFEMRIEPDLINKKKKKTHSLVSRRFLSASIFEIHDPTNVRFIVTRGEVGGGERGEGGGTDYNDYASTKKPRRIHPPRRLTVFELIRESRKAYDNVRWHEPSGGLGLQRVSLGYPPPVHSRMFVYSIGKHSATQCQVVTVVPCVLICLPPEPLPSPGGVSADPLEYPGARETPEAHVSAPSFSCPLSFNALVPDYT